MKYLASILILLFSLLFLGACGSILPHTAIVLIKAPEQITVIDASGTSTQGALKISGVYIKGNDITSKKHDIQDVFIPFGITWYGESSATFKIFGMLNATQIFDTSERAILDIENIQQSDKIHITITEVKIDTSTNDVNFETKVEKK